MQFNFIPAPAGGQETEDALLGTILETAEGHVGLMDDGEDFRNGNDDGGEGESEADEGEDHEDGMDNEFWETHHNETPQIHLPPWLESKADFFDRRLGTARRQLTARTGQVSFKASQFRNETGINIPKASAMLPLRG